MRDRVVPPLDYNAAPALWIGPADWREEAAPLQAHPWVFRCRWKLGAKPRRALLHLTSHARYALSVNGKAVAYGPARCFPERTLVDAVDITSSLRSGANVMEVTVFPSSAAIGYAVVGRVGLWAWLRAEMKGSEVFEVLSDADWQVRRGRWISSAGRFISLPAGAQEHYSATLLPEEDDEGWEPARVLGPPGTPPWKRLEPRPIPLLQEQPADSLLVWRGRSANVGAPPLRPVDDLARHFNDTAIEALPVEAPEGREAGGWLILDTSAAEAANVLVFDLGNTRLIRPGLHVLGVVPEGVRFELFYDLVLKDRPTALLGFNDAREGFCDSFTLRPTTKGKEEQNWEASGTRGCRFITVRLSGTGRVAVRLAAKTVDYPYPERTVAVAGQAPRFASSDQLLKRIWEVSATTLRAATSDVIVDTCARENVLWTFDACVAGKAAFFTFGESRMWRRCLSLIAQGIDADGIPLTVVPAQPSFMTLIDQALHWAISCRDYGALTGDDSLATEVVAPLKRLLALCARHMTEEGLFVPPGYAWHWIDQAPIQREPYSLPINALLLLAAEAGATIARRAWRVDGAGALGSAALGLAEQLRVALLRFWDEEAGCFADHVKPSVSVGAINRFGDTGGGPVHGIHGNALAARARVGTPEQRDAAAAFVARRLGGPQGPENTFGPGWTELLLAPLFVHGHGVAALEALRQRYGAVLDAGAPTWGESFAPEAFNTAHCWGASVNTLLAETLPQHPVAGVLARYEAAGRTAAAN